MKNVKFSPPPITKKLISIFHTRKADAIPPVFNQPLNTSCCPHHRLSRMLHVIFLALLILIAIPVIALKAMTYSFIEDNRDMGFQLQTTERGDSPGEIIVMAALPRMLYSVPAKLALVAAAISIFLGVAHMGFVTMDWRQGKRTQSYAFRRNIMLLHITNAILVLFALVSIYVTHKNTSHFRNGYVNHRASHMNASSSSSSEVSYFRYNIGTFDLETWACELQDEPGAAMVQDDYAAQCSNEIAGRAVMIPFVVVAWIAASLGIWGLVGGGRRGPDGERIKTVDVGLEMGKMNAVGDD
ncbi:hypothetical protein BDW02DRAFT_302253 [Decorospora gaudefroyi]|uniref:Uncharacterized protein n=1 Tax=Decorospora gaudefroyi TaxID=184978 RepID=A0A6A5KHA1_9PLEO|nr:hypothetical protein BDW02DRAFT_302253 [Decorospora gaudefroyi]